MIRQCGESLDNRGGGEEWSNCCAIVWKEHWGPLHVGYQMFSKKTDIMCARRVSTTNSSTVAEPLPVCLPEAQSNVSANRPGLR
jgi:hypothetical protein